MPRLRTVKMILPALTEATGPFWRPIKYSLLPPLGDSVACRQAPQLKTVSTRLPIDRSRAPA
jgi:hypothetical protein